ncbi:MAG: serine/threonine-protein kinase, partial [Planctomycetota bacterium]
MADPVNRVGETIGGYRVLEEIGRGGFGAVYKAVDPSGRQVALKIALEPRHARHLKNEGRFQERVKHPHAVEVYELRHDHDPAFMAVELVDGETLDVRIKREGRLSVTEALRIATELLSALAVAHDQGIVHRDLKPHNVLLDELGSVKLFDFGLARDKAGTSALLPSIESRDASKIAGSLPYVAPEQKVPGGLVDARADVYAFGIMLFEMLTGTRPEGGELPTELRPDLDPGLDRLFRGCYARR